VTRAIQGVAELRDGGRLAFDDVGEGPAVVLIHPGLWDRRVWEPQIGPLVEAGYRVVRYDQPGFGGSPPATSPFSDEVQLAWLLDDRGIDRAVLVGCSVGGTIATIAALTYPDRVRGLALIASGLHGMEWDEERWAAQEEAERAALAAGDVAGAVDLALRVWAPLGTEDPAGAQIRRIALENPGGFLLDGSLSTSPPFTALSRLGEIDVPTLVVTPTHDAPEILEIGRILASKIPEARPIHVEDADHVVSLRQPEALTDALLTFLDALPEEEG
jgi:pimeloyl-ACP methyl ester carboxylesterase